MRNFVRPHDQRAVQPCGRTRRSAARLSHHRAMATSCGQGRRVCGPPFSVSEAHQRGLTPKALRGPRVRRLHNGVYVCAGTSITQQTRVAAALLTLPEGTAVSHLTALQLRGVQLGPRTPLHFTTPHARQVRRPGMCVHRRTQMPRAVDGRLSAERAFVDSAAVLGFAAAVAAGDWLLHARLTERDRLINELAASPDVHGVGAARAALAFVRPRVESPRETLLVLAGLPEPATNMEVTRDGTCKPEPICCMNDTG